MDQTQFNKSYKAKHMLATFPPAPHFAYTFVLAAQCAAENRSETEQHNANNGSTFGSQEDNHHTPQRKIFDKCPIYAPVFEKVYQDFAPLKHTIKAVFFETW